MISDISRSTFRPSTDMFSVSFGVCVHRGSFLRSEVTGLESHDIWYGFLVTWGLLVLFIICFYFFISVSCCAFCVLFSSTWSFGRLFLLTFPLILLLKFLWAGFMVFLCWVWSCLWLSSLIHHLVPPLSPPSRHSPHRHTGVFFTIAIIFEMKCLPTSLLLCVSPYTRYAPPHQSHLHASHETP
ncbi:hypothetical protein BGX38DRAFT_750349 [Terfezia claveryi]|nr:hypothetical protein BGX38DRAFT_750349 [Terfezia claveryi]